MRSPSDRRFGTTAIVVLISVPLLLGAVRITGQVIVTETDRVTEDLYAFAERVIVDGVVEGDLIVVSGDLTIRGTVEGDVLGLVGGPVRIDGTVGGSVRLAATSVTVDGIVGDDLATLAGDTRVGGSVGRDLLTVSARLRAGGATGRDLRGQALRLAIDGQIERNVVVETDRLSLSADARIGGDLTYDSPAEGRIHPDAVVAGDLRHRDSSTPVWTRAILRALGILSLMAFILGGLVTLWLFRATSEKAVEAVATRPGRAALVGTALVLLPPLAALPLFLSLVGIPIALAMLLAWVGALFFGPIPAVTEVGRRLLRSRASVAGGLVLGAVLLRGAMWLLPLIGGLVYLVALVVGLGGYGMASWELRRQHAAG